MPPLQQMSGAIVPDRRAISAIKLTETASEYLSNAPYRVAITERQGATAMIFGFIVFSAIATMVLADCLPKPEKTAEEKLGEAVISYLKSTKDSKGGKDSQDKGQKT